MTKESSWPTNDDRSLARPGDALRPLRPWLELKSAFVGMARQTRFIIMAVANVASVYELGDRPNQSVSFNFLKRKFDQSKPVFGSVHLAWFHKWPWLHYDQVKDKMFCYTCVWAFKQGSVSLVPKKGCVHNYERSEVGCKLSRSFLQVAICFI